MAYELQAYVIAGNWNKQLFGGDDPFAASRDAIDRLLS